MSNRTIQLYTCRRNWFETLSDMTQSHYTGVSTNPRNLLANPTPVSQKSFVVEDLLCGISLRIFEHLASLGLSTLVAITRATLSFAIVPAGGAIAMEVHHVTNVTDRASTHTLQQVEQGFRHLVVRLILANAFSALQVAPQPVQLIGVHVPWGPIAVRLVGAFARI